MRDLALDRAAGRLEDRVYLDRLKKLRESKDPRRQRQRDRLRGVLAPGARIDVALAGCPETKAGLLDVTYEPIVVTGRTIVSSSLTRRRIRADSRWRCRTEVAMARPTGVGHALTAYRIPIEGRDDWLACAEVRSA